MLKKTFLACVTTMVVLSLCQTGHAQMFFEADWLFMDRNNDGDGSIVSGLESLDLGAADYDFSSGYRLVLGGQVGAVDVDMQFSQIDTWEGGGSGTILGDIILDDSAGMGVIPAGGNILNPRLGLSRAATDVFDETLESEQILGPVDWDAFSRSNYRDFEVNVGTNRACRTWRASVGYRHIRLDERSGVTMSGIFDAFDIVDGSNVVGGDPNDGLAGSSLNAVGFNTISGGDFDLTTEMMAGPDELTYQVLGSADNELNGAQVTFAGRMFDGEWVTVEGFVKAGLYRNNITASVSETVLGSGPDGSLAYQRELSGDALEAAFAGNIGFRTTVSLTDYINLISGYEVLFLSGVAIGPDQINGVSTDLFGDTTYNVINDGSVVAHGGKFGLEIIW